MNDQVAVEAPQASQEQVEAESNAAFEKGFQAERSDTPPPVEKPTVEAVQAEEPQKTVEPKVEAQPDKWEGVSPTVKAELESVAARLAAFDKLPDRLRNIEGHIGGITSQLKTALATAKAVEKTGADAPSQAQIEAAGGVESPRWKQLKEDFPDWAEAMDERLASLKPAPAPAVDVSGIKSEVTAEVNQRLKEATNIARQLALIDLKHEGWEDKVKTPEYKAWIAVQAPEVKALEDSVLAKDAIALLDKFAAAQATAAKEREKADKTKRLAAAVTPKGAAAAAPTTLNDDDAFERGFEKGRT